MIFFLVMPGLLGGYGNLLIPLYLGSADVTYPRVNALSILIVPMSYLILINNIYSEFSLGTGWTLYPPLSTSLMSLSTVGLDITITGLILVGI
jgi:cytochrome c oxidase subunit 1